MSTVDVLLINPSALSQIYQALSSNLAAVEPPIWAALIAQHLRCHGRSVELLDCEGEGLTVDQAVKRCGEINPRLTVIVVYGQQPSASTQNMFAASLLCQRYKEIYPDRKVLLVGGHVSALPAKTIQEEQADFVCQGEGPHTIQALLDVSRFEDETELKNIPGLWFRDRGTPTRGASDHVIPQNQLCEKLPGMAWDLLPMKNYRAHNWHCFSDIHHRQPYASLYTSLGCPFKCTFCCINAPFGQSSFRYWDPQFMIKQFDLLANTYGVKNIKLADEMFVLNEKHFMELCKLIRERGYEFNIWAYSRIDTIKPRHLETLREAGVTWLALGIESKSKFVRDGVVKGRFQDEDIGQVVADIKAADINVIGNYIFGLPDDSWETMQETLDLSLDLNCEMSNFYSAMAYPGSQLYEMAIQNHWQLPDSWLGYSQHAFETLPLPTKHLKAGEVLWFRDHAWNTYFTSPTYLELVRKKFGEGTFEHIRDMTKIQLKRKFAQPPPRPKNDLYSKTSVERSSP